MTSVYPKQRKIYLIECHMDNRLRNGDKVIMQIARTFLTILMMLIVLPWGAYAGSAMKTSKSSSHQFGSALENTRNLLDNDSWISVKNRTKISAEKKCRGVSLLGTSCGPDHALPMSMALSPKRYLPALPSSFGIWRVRGREVATPRGPPRLF